MDLGERLGFLRQNGFTVDEARMELYKEGYSLDEINAATESYAQQVDKEFSARNPKLSNRWTPLVLLILNFLLFFYLLPDDIAAGSSIFFALVGCAITLVLAFWTVAKLLPELLDKLPIGVFFGCLALCFGFGIAFLSKTSDYSANDLREHGEVVMARVSDKTRIYGRRGRSITSITVQFRTRDKINAEASIDVSEGSYDRYYVGMELPVIYSDENPGNAEIATDAALEAYGR